ncbi:BlaI/MecI/CopY family transcriptional regulator [Undibacterium sp.]|uniref:BlaI/MecI/CopY family transcriptional regulator n=1 Tax=Undibacterium sp. TaxID=1914977 RepID=UPI002731B581|nr:BlaI/MecI/CopY family transcriptional regulator [Undibacterium sp.]MDP1980358.1 BlaI/MecI/CopY family transcriptional regulator [Undibacterium sp.]
MKNIAISEAESLVMETLWQRHPLAAEEVSAILVQQQDWQEATVKTLLNRLLKKGAIKAEKDGRRFLYSPILKREQWLMSESKGFLDRMFNGRIAPLVAHFSEQKKLSKQDIAELKRLIKELGDDE